MFDSLLRFSEHIESEMSFLPASQYDAMMNMVIVRGSFELLQKRGAQFGWTYEQVEELRFLFTLGLSIFNRAYNDARQAKASKQDPQAVEQQFIMEMGQAGKFLEQFVNRYRLFMHREHGPFNGCIHCPSKCVYRSEVKVLLSTKNREWISEELSSDAHHSQMERFQAAAQAAWRVAQNWLGEEQDREPDQQIAEAGYCAALHTIASPDYTEYEQVIIANGISQHIFRKAK
jgi:hypothetical protein